MSIKEIISNNFNININKEDISPPSFVTKELISNSFSININKLEDIPPTVVEKEVISNSFNININKTSIPIDIPVESVSVNPNLKDMFVGDTFQIVYTITPSNATNKDVVFSSDNRSVATVNANTGVVEAKGVGECNITCTTVDGNKSDICNVTVREKAPDAIPVQSVTIAPKQLNLTVGEFHTFSYTIVPENATNKDVVFVSDNTEIATINGNTVTAVTEGSCKVYVRTLDGNKEDVCDLTVISNEIEGENTPPVLSVVLVSSERPDGSYVLNYNVIDKDQDEITHKLKIDNSEFTTINPNQDGIYCTYNGTGLTAGEHTGYIQISDGENTVTSKKFIINIPIETESIKEQLKLAKNNYDIKHDNLKNVINSIIEDRVFDEETEGYVLDNAFNEYNIALAKYREISQKAIDSIANKKSHDLQDKFNKDIIDINFAVNGLENTMNGAFKDGILTESEKLSIKQHLLTLSSEKSDVDKQYETIFANEHLEGQPKTDLSTAYNSYVLAYNSLVTVINNILEKEGLIDSTDRNRLNNAFKEHDSKLGLYSTNATNALDAIAKKKAEVESEKLDKKFADIIIDLEEGITSKVEHLNKQVNGDGGISERLKLAEEKITEDGITQIVKDTQFIKDMDGKITTNSENITKIDQKADRIDLSVQSKVDGNSIISAINMSPESIKINSSKINITGFVTFSDLSTPGSTNISGSNITTGYVKGNRIDAKNLTVQTNSGINTLMIDSSGQVELRPKSMTVNTDDKITFLTTNNYRNMLLYGGQVCVYNNTDDSFMATIGHVLRSSNSTYKGVGILAGKGCNTFFIGRDSTWGDILTNRSPNPLGSLFINFESITAQTDGVKGIHLRDITYTNSDLIAIENTRPNISGFNSIQATSGVFDNWKCAYNEATVMRYNANTNMINLGKNLNVNGFSISGAARVESPKVYMDSLYALNGNYGKQLIRTNGWDMFNGVNWDWQGYNILSANLIGCSVSYSLLNTINQSVDVESSKIKLACEDISKIDECGEVTFDIGDMLHLLYDRIVKLEEENKELRNLI